MARVFKADIRSTTRSDEEFKQTEKGKGIEIDLEMNLQSKTEVSTVKVLEEVQIAERWTDSASKVSYAPAGIERELRLISARNYRWLKWKQRNGLSAPTKRPIRWTGRKRSREQFLAIGLSEGYEPTFGLFNLWEEVEAY